MSNRPAVVEAAGEHTEINVSRRRRRFDESICEDLPGGHEARLDRLLLVKAIASTLSSGSIVRYIFRPGRK